MQRNVTLDVYTSIKIQGVLVCDVM